MAILQDWAIKILLSLALIVGFGYICYSKGEQHQISKIAMEVVVEDKKVDTNNLNMQNIADVEAKTQIVYKDRIVVKYQTIEKKVIQYEQSKDAGVFLDPEFVRLHDLAASSIGQETITKPSSGTDNPVTDAATVNRVTTGDAIRVITANYNTYYELKLKLDGWNRFYDNIQKEFNSD